MGRTEHRRPDHEAQIAKLSYCTGTVTPTGTPRPPVDEDIESDEDRRMLKKAKYVGLDEAISWEELRWRHYEEEARLQSLLEAEDQDEDEKGAEHKEEEQIKLPQYILSYTQKKKLCRIHRKGGCWRKPGVDYKEFEYVYDLEDLASKVPFCKDCTKVEKAASSSDSSSSTDTDDDTDEEEKNDQRQEVKQLTKLFARNLKKDAEEKRAGLKRPREDPRPEDLEAECSDGFGKGLFESSPAPFEGSAGGTPRGEHEDM